MRSTIAAGWVTLAVFGAACAHNPPAYTRELPLLLAKSDSTPAGRILTLEARVRAILYSERPQRLARPYLDSIRVAKADLATQQSVPPETVMLKLSTWQAAAREVTRLLSDPERLQTPSGKRRLQNERTAFEDYCRTIADSLLCVRR